MATAELKRPLTDFIGSGVKDAQIVDYRKLEGDKHHRKSEKGAFIGDQQWSPAYDYPKLAELYDAIPRDASDEDIIARKSFIIEAIIRLEEAISAGDIGQDEAELYANYYEVRLKRVLLVEAAKRLKDEGASELDRTAFMELNESLFGSYDKELYKGMTSTEAKRIDEFEPANERAGEIKRSLTKFFEGTSRENKEPELLDEETTAELRVLILERDAHILEVIPDTDDTIYYDAEQCREMMQRALEAGGLATRDWMVKIDGKKANPATDADKKIISLPANTRRTASQLRRLIEHEQEVHARRGQNGADSGFPMLQFGTADYADVEEGLGVLKECILAGSFDNPSFHRARDRYICAGLALGADGPPRDARQTYEILWRMFAVREARDGAVDQEIEEKAKVLAYTHVENAFRGTNFAMPGIIYTKLKVYYEGLKKNADYFMRHKNNLGAALDVAEIGKMNHTDPTEVRHIQSLVA